MQKCFHPGWNTHIGANKIFLKKSGGRMIHLLKPKEISIEGIKFLGGSRCGVCNRPTQVLMSQVSPGCREWLLKRGVAIAVGEPPRCCWSLQLRNTLLRLSVISPMSYERVLRGLYLCRARDVRVCPRAFTTWNRHYYVLAYAVCNYNFRGLLLSSAYFFLLLLFFSLFFSFFLFALQLRIPRAKFPRILRAQRHGWSEITFNYLFLEPGREKGRGWAQIRNVCSPSFRSNFHSNKQ